MKIVSFRRWPTSNGLPPRAMVLIGTAVIFVLTLSYPLLDINFSTLIHAPARLVWFLGNFFTSPDWEWLGHLAVKLAETVEMALLGTLVAAVISLPLGFLGARNASPHPFISHMVRACLSSVRAFPEMMWALVFVAAVGLGALPGVAAIALVTVGFLGKFLAESLEAVPNSVLEGVIAHGARPMQVRAFALLPHAWPDFVSVLFVVFEHNVRAATVLGLVGAGGIGYDMTMAMRLFQFDRLVLIILAIWLVVTILDRLSDALRRRII
ncbi:MAG: Phosphate-import permease protein PhnE [Alphaproteobacteria bacterium MarineAlpha9_Bin7]|nr:MAG: Phosphate-import permease protein PhnE [Alphaproteobacteria bacterium MarineAlpha9_Bin7]